MNEEIHLFLSYAASDKALVAPLISQLQTVQEQHSYFFVETQRHEADLEENAELLEQATLLVVVVSRAYFRDPFYRSYLRRRADLPGKIKVETLWVQPLIVTNEPLLRLVAPPMAERTALADLQRQGWAQLEAYYDTLVEHWVAAGWRSYLGHKREAEERERRRLLAEAEAERRRARRTAIASASGLLALLLFIFFGDNLLPSPEPAPMASPEKPPRQEETTPFTPPQEQAGVEEPSPEPELPSPLPQEPPPSATVQTEPKPPPVAQPESAPTTRGNPGQYEEYYDVGEGRIVALLPGRIGWVLLDANWRPVSDQHFRRVYYKPGFVDGKLKVKIGDEIVYVDRMGRKVRM